MRHTNPDRRCRAARGAETVTAWPESAAAGAAFGRFGEIAGIPGDPVQESGAEGG